MNIKFKIPIFDEILVKKLCVECDIIEDKINNNIDASKEIKAFNLQVNYIPDDTSFNQYYSWCDQEEFIKGLLVPKVLKDDSLTKDDFIELLKLVINADGEMYEVDYWMDILSVNLCKNLNNLLFHSETEMTIEEIYEKCKNYKESIIYL